MEIMNDFKPPKKEYEKKDNFFLKTKTHRVLTWPARILAVLVLLGSAYVLIPVAKHIVVSYTVDIDEPRNTQHLVVENWNADVDVFEQTAGMAKQLGNPEIWALVFERPYMRERTRKQALVNAWAAGLDTSRLKLLLVRAKEPKTYNNARAIVDTARKLGWNELTLATLVFHSARSKKALLHFTKDTGIQVYVLPYFEAGATPQDWYETDTGQAEVLAEFVKRLFYDIYVFGFRSSR